MGLKRRNKVSAEFSMSSLTDIIFLLLIFFMLTSTLVSQNALNLKLPSSNSTTVAPPSLSVSIKKNGNYYLNANQVTASKLRSGVRAKVQQDPKASLTIAAEKGTPIEYVVAVMDIANDLGISAILATEPKK